MSRMPDNFINCCITSPPYYGLRDYNHPDQIGLEESPEEYVQNIIKVFSEVKRVLKKDGTLWLNLGDTYWGGKGQSGQQDKEDQEKRYKNNSISSPASHVGGKRMTRPTDRKHIVIKPKDLIGIPWMVAFALRADGWYLRQDIIWSKPNPMPESVKDRCTKSHEYIFLLSKSAKYYFNNEAIQEGATGYDGRNDTLMKGSEKYKTSVIPGRAEHIMASRGHERWRFNKDGDPIRNKRSVWTVNLKPFKEAHFATFPEKLIVDCIKAGCPEGGIVYDPFGGAATTAKMSHLLKRNWVISELNQRYVDIGNKRIHPYLDQLTLF